jgi:hypothetical protein
VDFSFAAVAAIAIFPEEYSGKVLNEKSRLRMEDIKERKG